MFNFFTRKNTFSKRNIYTFITTDREDLIDTVKEFAINHDFNFQKIVTTAEIQTLIKKDLSKDVAFFYTSSNDIPSVLRAFFHKASPKGLTICAIIPSTVKTTDIIAILKPAKISSFFKEENFSKEKILKCFTDLGLIKENSENQLKIQQLNNEPDNIVDKEPHYEPDNEDVSSEDILSELDKEFSEEPEEEPEPAVQQPIPEQTRTLINPPTESENCQNEQTILVVSPYSEAGTTILSENFVVSLSIMMKDIDVPIAFVDFSFPPKATFHLQLSKMLFPAKRKIEIRPVAMEKYWRKLDPIILNKESIPIYNGKIRIFQAFCDKNTFNYVQKNPSLISKFISDLKTVYPVIVISASNGYNQPYFEKLLLSSTGVIGVMKYIKNPLPDDIATFLLMHNEIQQASNIEKYIVALNKVTSNLTRDERKIMNNFNPYVQVPFVESTKMHAVVNGTADFNLPIFIGKEGSYQPFVTALGELVNAFFG